MNKIPPSIQQTLFGKFFYSPSLFTYHTSYKNRVYDIQFEWSRHESIDNLWPPFYKSIVKTKLVKETIEFDKNQNIISYRKTDL